MGQFHDEATIASLFASVFKRLAGLERTQVVHGTGAPGTSVTEPYVDDSGSRVYFKVNGVWKSAALS